VGHGTTQDFAAGIAAVRLAPTDVGIVELIVARPGMKQRAVLDEAELTIDDGLVGDGWRHRKSRTADGAPDVDRQLTIMSTRAIALFASTRDDWALAGDQLFVDLDLSHRNLPTGTRLSLGTAVIEVTDAPHNGCAKFADRFGIDAARFVNTPDGKELRLRGINARVVQPGRVTAGCKIAKQP
jgi:MOSC domain-containing protein YiiM